MKQSDLFPETIATVEGQEDEDTERHVVIAKNKLKGGWHGVVTVQLDGERARFTA